MEVPVQQTAASPADRSIIEAIAVLPESIYDAVAVVFTARRVFWAMLSILLAVAVAVIGGICGSGGCGSSDSPSVVDMGTLPSSAIQTLTPTNTPSVTPLVPPTNTPSVSPTKITRAAAVASYIKSKRSLVGPSSIQSMSML